MNPTQAAQHAESMRQAANTPAHVRELIAQAALDSQRVVTPFGYYSKVRFQSALTGADPNFVYTIAGGVARKAFGYGIQGDMAPAGFVAGTLATEAETNLADPGKTRDNSEVIIWGIGIEIDEDNNDPILVRKIFANCDVQLALNSSGPRQLGRLSRFPYPGGLCGQGVSRLAAAPTFQTLDSPQGALSNGEPNSKNYFELPSPLFWNPTGSGQKDVSLSVLITPRRDIIVNQPRANRAAVAANAVATTSTSGCEAWTMPLALGQGTAVDLIVHLIAVEISQRSGSL